MSDGLVFIIVLPGVFGVGGGAFCVAHFFAEYDGSITLWRATRKRDAAKMEKAAYFMSLGFDKESAVRKATNALNAEAAATEKEMPA